MIMGKVRPYRVTNEIFVARIPIIWDIKTTMITLDTAMRFGRATKIPPSCLCSRFNCF
jgi:hypothetical protein